MDRHTNIQSTPFNINLIQLPLDIMFLILSFLFYDLFDNNMIDQTQQLMVVSKEMNNHLLTFIKETPSLRWKLIGLIMKKTTPKTLEKHYKNNFLFEAFSSFEELVKTCLIHTCLDNPKQWIDYLVEFNLIDSDFGLEYLKEHPSCRYIGASCLRDIVIPIIRDRKRIPGDIFINIVNIFLEIYEYPSINSQGDYNACTQVFKELLMTWRNEYMAVYSHLFVIDDEENTNYFFDLFKNMTNDTDCMFAFSSVMFSNGRYTTLDEYEIPSEHFHYLDWSNGGIVSNYTRFDNGNFYMPLIPIPVFFENVGLSQHLFGDIQFPSLGRLVEQDFNYDGEHDDTFDD
jgi:hypothetical protein